MPVDTRHDQWLQRARGETRVPPETSWDILSPPPSIVHPPLLAGSIALKRNRWHSRTKLHPRHRCPPGFLYQEV